MAAYQDLPADAKVWIYQADRAFTDYEAITIQRKLDAFVADWTSHKKDVKALGQLYYNRFIVLMADERSFRVSGCSIDSSVAFIKELGQTLEVDFFNRFNIAYIQDDKAYVADKQQFRELFEQGKVDENTIVFNNLVQTKEEFENNWQIPLKESWQMKVFAA